MTKHAPFWSRLRRRSTILSPDSLPYLLAVVAVSLLTRLTVSWFIYGTDDMTSWIGVARLLNEGKNPYETGRLNWPPLWPALILYSSRLSAVYNLPIHFAIKLAPVIADTALACVVYSWKLRDSRPPSAFRFALWIALNPVSIGTSAAGGQFDSIAALFGTLAVLTAQDLWSNGQEKTVRIRSVAIPAVWLGLGGFAKTWPLLLLAVLIPKLRGWPNRGLFAAISIAPAAVSVWLLYRAAPEAIQHNVLAYRGSPGWWGVTAPVAALSSSAAAAWVQITTWLFYLSLVGVAAILWNRGTVIRNALVMLLTFYVFTTGLGLQYLVWILSFGLIADAERTMIYTALATAVLAIEYIFRPFSGVYGQFLTHPLLKSPEYVLAYGAQRDQLLSCLVRAPLWLYCCYWWYHLLRTAAKARQSADGLAH